VIDSFFKCVEAAYGSAKQLLWPIHKGVWFKLFLFFILTGSMGMVPSVSTSVVDFFPALIKSRFPVPDGPQIEVSRLENLEYAKQVFNEIVRAGRVFVNENKSTLYGFAAIVLAMMVLLAFIFLWVYSRFKLVLLKSLVSRQVLLKSWWRDTGDLGNSFFRWNIFITGFLCLFVLSVVGGVIYGFLAEIIFLDIHWPYLLFGAMTFVAISIALWAFFWFFHELVPIVMVQTGTQAGAAMRYFWPTRFKAALTGMLVVFFYALFSFVISLVVAFMLVLGSLLALLLSVGVVLAGVFVMKLLGSVVGVVFFTLAGLLIFLMMMALALIYLVPLETFFHYLKIEIVKPVVAGYRRKSVEGKSSDY
jgi:hypothetical protein